MGLETVTRHRDGINADMNEKLGPVISTQIDCVPAFRHGQYLTTKGRVYFSFRGVNGYAITQDPIAKNRVRVITQRSAPTFERRTNFQHFLIKFIHVVLRFCPVDLYPVDSPDRVNAVSVETDTQVRA